MPNIELSDIDAQIAKLQELRKIVADPQMAALLNQVLASKNGAPAATEGKANRKGSFIAKIEEICRAFGSQTFTIQNVIEAYLAKGYTFKAQNQSVATYTAMKRLVKAKRLELDHKGGGGSNPDYYRVSARVSGKESET